MTSNLKGFKELNTMLLGLPDAVESKVLQKAVTAALKEALPAFQAAAPRHETGKQSAASKEYGSILANMRVANKKFAGKGQKGAIITTWNAFWSYFSEFGTRHQAADPWFVPTYEREQAKILESLKNDLGTGIEAAAAKLLGK